MVKLQRLMRLTSLHQATEQALKLAAIRSSLRMAWVLWYRFFATETMMVSSKRLMRLTSLHQATEHAWNLDATRSSPRAVWMLCSRFFATAQMMMMVRT